MNVLDWRKRFLYAIAAPVAAIVVAVLITSLTLIVSGNNPIEAFKAMWQYSDSTESVVGFINRAVPYYVAGVAVGLGFQMNLFNIGVDGQYRLAAVLAAAAGAQVHWIAPIHVLFICVVAMAVGAGWAAVPAVLKVKRGVNEVVSTIMLNYVATGVMAYLLANYLRSKSGPGDLVTRTKAIPASGLLPYLDRPLRAIGFHLGKDVHLQSFVLAAIAIGVAYYLMLFRSRFGYELRASGMNPSASRLAGVDPNAMVLRTMLLSGAVAGLIGIAPLLGDAQFQRYTEQFPTQFGFTGIAVALLGRNQPVGIAVGALLFSFIERATQVLSTLGIPPEIAKIMQGTLLLSAVIAYAVVRRFADAAAVKAAALKADAARRAAPSATVGASA